jgi:hypothetical protein
MHDSSKGASVLFFFLVSPPLDFIVFFTFPQRIG